MIIYEPNGRAREYSNLAVNLYSGCSHCCLYCYAPSALRKARCEFHRTVQPRKNIIALLEADCKKSKFSESADKQVLLSFTSDPYQEIENELKITREAIIVLHNYGFSVQILTKGGTRAVRDFDLLKSADAFATTMTFLNREKSLHWEPAAALPKDRIDAIKKAKLAGIPTWVSLEPVIEPLEAIEIVRATHEFVDFYKIGPLNYRPESKVVNWRKFGFDISEILNKHNKKFYLKKDLQKYMSN